VRAPAKRPKAIRTHTYAPPSAGTAAPSSALARAEGMKKKTNSTTSQVKACPPPMAMAPMVSTTTMAEMRKKMVSSRLSSRRSLAHSACPASPVAVSRTSWAVIVGLPR